VFEVYGHIKDILYHIDKLNNLFIHGDTRELISDEVETEIKKNTYKWRIYILGKFNQYIIKQANIKVLNIERKKLDE